MMRPSGSCVLTRRSCLALLGGGLAQGWAACQQWPLPKQESAARQLQVVAHPDDDILFMNPDVAEWVRTSRPSATVVLTAGESDVPDPASYAAARQAGSRAAYAAMAGVADDWKAEELAVDAQHSVELHTLRGQPSVQLVFVNLPDDNDPNASGGRNALLRIWQDSIGGVRVRSLLPEQGAVRAPSDYSRAELIDMLAALFARFAPTVIRVQDPDPDHRYTTHWPPLHDHPDHVIGARLARAAADAWARSDAHSFVQLSYRDYNIEEVPANLEPSAQQAKIEIFRRYVPHDRFVVTTGGYDAWPRRMIYRWPRGSSWVASAPDGLCAVAILSGRPVGWRSGRADRGGWAGPATLPDPGGPLAPTLSVTAHGLGRWCVFGLRTDTDRVVALRSAGSGWERGWTDLGNPNEALNRPHAPDVGCPAVTTTGDDRIVLVARNGAGGVSVAMQGTSVHGWPDSWIDLGGVGVQDTPAAVTASDGRARLLASTPTTVLLWVQTGAAVFAAAPSPRGPVPAGPPVATRVSGQVALAYPVAGTAELALATSMDMPARVLPGPGGPGTPAMAHTASGELVLVGRGPSGQLRAASVRVDSGAFSGWADLPGIGTEGLIDGTALATSANGQPVAIALTDRGGLLTRSVR